MQSNSFVRIALPLALLAGSPVAPASTIDIFAKTIDASSTVNTSCSQSAEGTAADCESIDDRSFHDGSSAQGHAYASANVITGVMQAGIDVDADPAGVANPVASLALNPLAGGAITEVFTIDGLADFGFAIDGVWDVAAVGSNAAAVSIFASVDWRPVGQITVEANDFLTVPGDVLSGSLDDTLSVRVFTAAPTDIRVTWAFSIGMTNAAGIMDFGNTGLLFTEVLDGSLVPATSDFLADQVYGTTVVPLPPAAVLLLGGIGALRLVRRK